MLSLKIKLSQNDLNIIEKETGKKFESEAIFNKYLSRPTIERIFNEIDGTLILTPQREPLSQRIKNSGWKCQIKNATALYAPDLKNGEWKIRVSERYPNKPLSVVTGNEVFTKNYVLTLSRPPEVNLYENELRTFIKLDSDGYPV